MAISRKATIIAAALAGTVALYALAGFFLLPMLALAKLPALFAEKTGQQAQLQAVRFNPFKFVLEVDGFSLASPNAEALLAFDAFDVDANLWASLTEQAVVLDSVRLRKPVVNIERRKDGSINLGEILAKDAQAAEDKKDKGSVPLVIHKLALEEGQVVWKDAVTGETQTETLSAIKLSFTELATKAEGSAAFELALGMASGGHLQWRGDLTLAPLASKGSIGIDEVALPKVWQLFLRNLLPLEVADGRLSLQTEYDAALGDSGLALSIRKGAIDVKKLEITEQGKADALIAIPAIALRGAAADLNKQQVSIASLTSEGAQIKSWLQADGKVNYQALLADQDTVPAPAPASDADTAPPSWQISLDELALSNYQVQFTDRTQPKPVEVRLTGLDFKLQKFSNRQGEKLPLQLAAQINDSGKLNVAGDIVLEPFSADFKLESKAIDLKPYQPYLENYLKLDLVNGEFGGSGQLKLALADPLQLNFHGDANLANLITRDQIKNKDFVKWADLQLQQIDIDLEKQDYKVDKVLFDQPYVRFVIKEDKSTNINDIVVSQSGKQTAAEKPAAKVKDDAENQEIQPVISIGSIELRDGKSHFADYSLILPFVADMNALNGTADGFSSREDAPVKMGLKGKVYDLALVSIKGLYQLQNGDSDIVLNFTHMPLPLITPYMAEFAGYRIEKGQMALDLKYKIKNGRLEAQNKVFIDQLTLGEKVENPNAKSLPLHLAVALLKDANGKINLDFPITGSLEDPKFSVGSLISDVLANLVMKAVKAPFRAFGALLDDKQDFSTVGFAAGSAALAPEEIAKLDQLGKALDSKPELVLEVKGMAYQSQDWPVMRFDALKDILKKMKSGELRDKGQNIRSEYIELSDGDYRRLLEKFFQEVFPGEIDYSLLRKPRIKAMPDADFYDAARQKLEAKMQPEPQRLNDLAVARANAIAKYLMETAGVDRDRVYILAPELDPPDTSGIVSVLSLNAAP